MILNHLDKLGIADDTLVYYSTDNGPHMNSWPDAGMTPFRVEKNTNWGGRLPRTGNGAVAEEDQGGFTGLQSDHQPS